jgi:hypothetical protein
MVCSSCPSGITHLPVRECITGSISKQVRMCWRPLLWATALCGALALTACAPASAPGGTKPSNSPQPTKIAVHAGDTSLCRVISLAQFSSVLGERVTQVMAGITGDQLTGLQEVYCIYVDTSDPQQLFGRGTINFEVASDAQIASTIFQTVKQSFSPVSEVRGVGAAAFAGSPGGAEGGTGLVVVQGNLLLYLSVGGDPQTVVRVTTQLAMLVLRSVE